MSNRLSAVSPRLALLLGVVALGLAVVGAVGPSEKERATYSWPPADLPAAEPDREWYAPLLLIRRVPASLEATVPCSGATPLPGAQQPLTILATARQPGEAGGLAIRQTASHVELTIGRDRFAMVERPQGAEDDSCSLRLAIDGDRWTVRGPSGTLDGDFGGRQPVVSGFFSSLDLTKGAAPAIEITTEAFGTTPILRQQVAWVLAALLAAVVFALGTASGRRRSARGLLPSGMTQLLRSLRLVDLFVVVLLGIWWFVGPVLYDDGWVKVRQTNYAESGAFSNYYSSFGVNLPLDYWLEWVQHLVVENVDTLLLLRLPALVLLGGTWALCRWVLGRVATGTSVPLRGAQWALAVAFVLNALAWDVTLRPEPVVAFLAVGALACGIRFVEQPAAGPLIVAALIVVLGVTAHPAGLVTAAPLLAVSPAVLRWARSTGWLVPVALAASLLAVALVVASVGSDVFQRASDARGIRDYGDAVRSWREELNRYLLVDAGASPMRRASVALMVAAALTYLVRRGRTPRKLINLPAASLALALVLMVPTPSKWIWHFGVLAGLGAVAVAAELLRVREGFSNRWSATPAIGVLAAMLVAGWAWFPRIGWGDFDLRTLDWTLGFEDRVTAVRASALVVLAGVAIVFVAEIVRRGRSQAARASWSPLPWLVPLAVLPVIGFTVVMLTLDAAKTSAWTLPRQNVESLAGGSGCGLADDTTVAQPTSMQALAGSGTSAGRAADWTARAPLPGLDRHSLLVAGTSNVLTTPWYRVPARPSQVGFFVSSLIGAHETVEASWGSRGATSEIVAVAAGERIPARALPGGSCYEAGSEGRLPDGRRTFHLRRIGGKSRDGFAIEGAGYVTEREFNKLWAGAELVPASGGAGFDPATLARCDEPQGGEALGSSPAVTRRVATASEFAGQRVAVPHPDTASSETIAWTFIPEGRLPPRPRDAEYVRFRLRSDADPPRAIALTGAVSYRTTSLVSLFEDPGARPLVWPNLVLYMPCRQMPRLANGIVEVPNVLVSRSGLWPIEFETSPFHSVLDLYPLRDLSVGDSEFEPENMHVYWVDREVPGAALAPVVRSEPG